jgi:Ca-activated chloride channel family protein
MAGESRPTYLIFLTDGLPTEGVVERQDILGNLKPAAPDGLRLFSFGVGYDVDTILLDSLAQDHHGTSTYVLPGERLDETLSGFYSKISSPVLTDLSLDFGEVTAYDIYPSPLPDLFIGSQILVVGRYHQGGQATVALSGLVDGERQTFRFPDQYFDEEGQQAGDVLKAIPRLWATRKIGYLLRQIDLDGPNQEVIDQIVRLSIRYGIVTPYTSYLVTEKAPLGEAEQARIVQEQVLQAESMPAAPVSGRGAVEKAAGQGAMSSAEAPSDVSQEAQGVVKIVGSRAFVLSDGVWVDTAFDPDKMETQKVSFLSEDYFKLIEARPVLGAAFSLGERVIAFSDGNAYEVVPEGEAQEPVQIPPTSTSQTATAQPEQAINPPQGDTAAAPTRESTDANPDAGIKPGQAFCLGGWLVLVLAMFWKLFFATRPLS